MNKELCDRPYKAEDKGGNAISPSATSTTSSIVNRYLKSLQGIEIWGCDNTEDSFGSDM